MPDERFRQAIAAKLKRRGRLPRAPRALHPDAQARAYRAEIMKRVKGAQKLVRERLMPRVEALLRLRDANRPEGVKQDAWPDDLADAFDSVKSGFVREFTEAEARAQARRLGISVAEFNKRQQDKVAQRVVGIDVFSAEPWLADQMAAFAIQNASLITGVTDDLFGELQAGIFEQMGNGARYEEIADFVEGRLGVSESRAAFIARDQVSTLNGQLTGLRQTNAGVEKYTWRTSLDERVRDSHKEKEGKVFSWASPPSDTGHPGEDYQCRCFAEPIFESVIDGTAEFTSSVEEED